MLRRHDEVLLELNKPVIFHQFFLVMLTNNVLFMKLSERLHFSSNDDDHVSLRKFVSFFHFDLGIS